MTSPTGFPHTIVAAWFTVFFLASVLAHCLAPAPQPAVAAGRFAAPFHVFTSMTCPDNSDQPPYRSESALDITTFDTSQTALSFLHNVDAPAQTAGVPDGWCDFQPETLFGSFTTTVPDQSIYLFNLPMDFVGLYLVFLPEGGSFSNKVIISAVVPIAAGDEITVYAVEVPAMAENPSLYFGTGHVELEFPLQTKITSLVGASIRPTPDQALTLKIQFPVVGTYTFSLIGQNAAQQSIRR